MAPDSRRVISHHCDTIDDMDNTDNRNTPMDLDTRLLKSRKVWLNGEVNTGTAHDVASMMLLLHEERSDEPITFLINSPGGSITDGCCMLDMCRMVAESTPIITLGLGMCASMGQIMLTCAGTPGLRCITRGTRVLVHQPSSGVAGTESDIRTQSELILSMKEQLAGYTASRTGLDVKAVLDLYERGDCWFTADDAVGMGLADHIVDSEDDIMRIYGEWRDAR